MGRNRVAVGNYLRTVTQGSACRATLGFGHSPVGADNALPVEEKCRGHAHTTRCILPHCMQPNSSTALGHLRRQILRWLFFAALFTTMSGTASAAETNVVAELGRNPEMSRKLGLEKLSSEEKEEWNRLLTTAYLAGVATGRTNRALPGVFDAPAKDEAQKKSASRLWLSKADLDSDDVVKLENGAIFKVSSGLVGVGLRREVALIQEGSRWSLWVSRKRVYRGELLRAPDSGKPIAFRRATISSVSSDGSVIKMLDESIYEIDPLGQIHTMLWLPTTEVFVLETGKIFDASGSGGELIDCRRLK